MWRAQSLAQYASGQAGGTSLNQQSKGSQAGFLREGIEQNSRFLYIHMSRLIDILNKVKIFFSGMLESCEQIRS